MRQFLGPCSLLLLTCSLLVGCGSSSTGQPQAAAVGSTQSVGTPDTLGSYPLLGDTSPVRDPSMIRQGSIYYVFSTDTYVPSEQGYLPVRCSADTVTWNACGFVFSTMPAWIHGVVPGATSLWAPDISYFGGLYHLYYAASTLFSQNSAIGEATNVTLDQSSPQYQWVDRGEVISSIAGDDFNALDPNILVDTDGQVWLTYGSFWSGIKQRAVDSSTGMLTGTQTYSLASRPATLNNAIEGASLIQHDGYYYLFLSTGECCESDYLDDNYEEIVGRSSSPNGPFLDMAGNDLMSGGGTVLLEGDATWVGTGGGSAYLDPSTGETLLAFHGLSVSENGNAQLWIKQVQWTNGWPSIN